jgi:hypothetical protein
MTLETVTKPENASVVAFGQDTAKILLDMINTKMSAIESRYEVRHKSQLQELKVASSGEAVVNQVNELQKNFAQVENRLKVLPANDELVKAAIGDRANDIRELTALKADMLNLANQVKAIKELLATGKGLQINDNKIDAREFAKYKKARLASASLAEVAELCGEK